MARTRDAAVDIKIRMREPLRADIERAAKEKGISMNAEMIERLSASFDRQSTLAEALDLAYGRQPAALLAALARAMDDAGRYAGLFLSGTAEGAADWLKSPDAVENVKRALCEILSAFQPEGYSPPEPLRPFVGNESEIPLGVGLARGILEAIKNPARGGALGDWAKPIRRRLGDLARKLRVDSSTVVVRAISPGPGRPSGAVATLYAEKPSGAKS